MNYFSAHRNHRRPRGSVIVEFALVIPVLTLLFLGVITYGYDFYTYNRLEEVVRAGARFGSTQEYDAYTSSGVTCKGECVINLPNTFDFAQRVARYVVFGDPYPKGDTPIPPLIEGLTTDNVVVGVRFVGGNPAYISVGIKGYTLRTPFGALVLNKPQTTFAYLGNFVPKKP